MTNSKWSLSILISLNSIKRIYSRVSNCKLRFNDKISIHQPCILSLKLCIEQFEYLSTYELIISIYNNHDLVWFTKLSSSIVYVCNSYFSYFIINNFNFIFRYSMIFQIIFHQNSRLICGSIINEYYSIIRVILL